MLAQDLFYMHREFDAGSGTNESLLKVAFKFVALTPGTTVLKSVYAEVREDQVPDKYDHWLRIIVLGD